MESNRSVAGTDSRGLRLIGAYKLVKSLAVTLGGLAVLRFEPSAMVQMFVGVVVRLRLDPDNRIIHTAIAHLSVLHERQLETIGAGLIVYGLLYGVEGLGLLYRKTWAEYLVIVTTGLLIPLEIFEIYQKPRPLRMVVLGVNVLIVIYLTKLLRDSRRERGGFSAEV